MTQQALFTGWPYSSWDYPGQNKLVAYFSMEIAITPAMPTYSGGLGILAGDTLRAAADMGLPLIAVTLAHRKGYVRQHLDASGMQSEEDQPWDVEAILSPEDPVITVLIEERTVAIRAWRFDLEGTTGHTIPIYLLDTDLEENDPRDRGLTDHLYGGDGDYRLRQEAVLGIGGARILEALCFRPRVYHLNEGTHRCSRSHCWSGTYGVEAWSKQRSRIWKRCANAVSLPPTRRFRLATIDSRWSRRIAF